MKKQYITPSAQAVELLAQGMMALSLTYGDTTAVEDETKVLSNEKGWSSSNWAASDGEE